MSDAAKKQVHWNDPKILDAAGRSPDAVRALLSQFDQPAPTDWAVYQWASRGKIPNHWRAALVYALLATKRIGLADLFRRGAPTRTAPASAE